jgi:PadR family transcriptional regulator PadR
MIYTVMNKKGDGCMNAQFKKGVLEMVVLLSLRDDDKYGYELVQHVSKIIDVKEGTIYPLLRRLKNDQYLETYLMESTEGPPRKYYRITATGITYVNSLVEDWLSFNSGIMKFIQESKGEKV